MKKRLLIAALAIMMVVCLAGCGTTYQETTGQKESNTSDDFAGGYFTVVTKWYDGNLGDFYIVYANDTKVKYFANVGYNRTGVTQLCNTDGTLQIYKESED